MDAVRDLFDWLLRPRENSSSAPPSSGADARVNAPEMSGAGSSIAVPGATGQAVPQAPAAPVPAVNPPGVSPDAVATPTAAVPAPAGMTTDPARDIAAPAATRAPDKQGTVSTTDVPAPRKGIALILPAKLSPFGRAGEVARQGFMAARTVAAEKPEIRVFETDGTGESARVAYELAVASNASVIVGPLTKAEVSGILGQSFVVPTLALNTPDGDAALPRNLFTLSLNIESEARAAAVAAYRADAGIAVIVSTGGALSRRAVVAFADTWVRQGGSIKETVEFAGSVSRVRQAVERARGDIVFLAADAERARLLRPYLGRNTPVIATSQVYAGTPRTDAQKPHDLNGLRFVDMPWLHQPDHAATMVFPRPETPLAADLERLYALGIDAFRVAGELARARTTFTLDGVTGALSVQAGVIQREPLQVEYRDGAVSPAPSR